MVVDNLHVVSIALLPVEADPPLVVDTDAVLTASIAVKSFQSVPREGKVAQVSRRIQLLQPPESLLSNAPESFRRTQLLI